MKISVLISIMMNLRNIMLLLMTLISPLSWSYSWVDVDGGAIVQFHKNRLSIYSLDSFFYFDEIFKSVRKDQHYLNLCFADGLVKKKPNDCFKGVLAITGFYHGGKNRALHLDVSNYSYMMKLVENQLLNNRSIKVSIDNGDLFSAYTLQYNNTLTEESRIILFND